MSSLPTDYHVMTFHFQFHSSNYNLLHTFILCCFSVMRAHTVTAQATNLRLEAGINHQRNKHEAELPSLLGLRASPPPKPKITKSKTTRTPLHCCYALRSSTLLNSLIETLPFLSLWTLYWHWSKARCPQVRS